MAVIESLEFSVALGVLSGLRAFLWEAEQHEAVRTLKGRMNSPEDLAALQTRVTELREQPSAGEYQNPSDTALAVYLWLLGEQDQALARAHAETILQQPSWGWARWVAQRLLVDEAEEGAKVPPAPPTAGPVRSEAEVHPAAP
jgi:hypothetical protein